MKIALLLPAAGVDDVICEDAVSLATILRAKGFQVGIYAGTDANLRLRDFALPLEQLPRLSGEDVLFYYPCAGSELSFQLDRLVCRKILLFYDMVPPRYWKGYQESRREDAEQGMQGLCHLANRVDYCMAASAFNASVLQELNYQCPIMVRPPLLSFSEYAKAPDASVMERYAGDGYTNFLFVGELVPHKKQENVIRAFYCYQKYCNPKSRLFLVGAYAGTERYYRRLRRYADALELDSEQVIFTDAVSFPELLAYYHLASLFLCMSEHEGFCVPLVEAMYFGVPILAYRAAAVPDILGGSGILLPTSDPMEAALMADRVLKNPGLRREVAAGQRRKQQDFAYPMVRKQLEQQFQDFLEQVPPRVKKRQPIWQKK